MVTNILDRTHLVSHYLKAFSVPSTHGGSGCKARNGAKGQLTRVGGAEADHRPAKGGAATKETLAQQRRGGKGQGSLASACLRDAHVLVFGQWVL